MAYGFRLNVEAVFWQAAIGHLENAKNSVVEREHRDPVAAEKTYFNGFSSDDALGPACMAVVCLAICVEASVNYAWNQVAGPKYPSERSRKKALRNLSITEKLDDIVELYVGPEDRGIFSFDKKRLKQLFDLRNRFVHFKEVVEFQSFTSASEVELLLAWDEMIQFRNVAKQTIVNLAQCCSLDVGFLDGDFEIVTIDR